MRKLILLVLLITLYKSPPISAQELHPCAALGKSVRWINEAFHSTKLIDSENVTYDIVGRGPIKQILWDANTDCILVYSPIGLWGYPADDLMTPPMPLRFITPDEDHSNIISLLSDGRLVGHSTSFAYSQDGQQRAVRYDEGQSVSYMQLVDMRTNTVIAQSARNPHIVSPLQLSDDGQTILSINDGTVSGWALDEKQQTLVELFNVGNRRLLSNVYDFGFDRRGYYPTLLLENRIYLGQLDGTIQVWNTSTSTLEAEWRGHVAAVTQLVLSPDHTQIASSGADGVIQLWDVQTGASRGILQSLDSHAVPIVGLAFSPDGTQLVSGDMFGTIRLWDVVPTEDRVVWNAGGNPLQDVAYSPEASTIAVAGDNGLLRLIEPETGHQIADLVGHTGAVNGVAFGPDGEYVVSAGDDTTLRLWNTTSYTEQSFIDDYDWPARDVTVDPQGEFIYSTGWQEAITVYTVENDYVGDWPGLTSYGESIAVSPNGLVIAVGSWDGSVNLWVRDYNQFSGKMPLVLTGQRGRINALAFSPDNRTLAAASQDGGVYLWDVTSPNVGFIGRIQGDINGVNDVVYSPDGQLIIGAGTDVWIWDAHTYRERTLLRGHQGPVNGLAVHPDSSTLLTVSDDGTLRSWNLEHSAERAASRHFGGVGYDPLYEEAPFDLTFDAQGTLISSNVVGNAGWLWEPETGQERLLIRSLGREIGTISLAPDGLVFAAGSKLWSAATGLQMEYWEPWDHKGFSGPFISGESQVVAVEYNSVYIRDLLTGNIVASRSFDSQISSVYPVTDRPWLVIQMKTDQAASNITWDYATDTVITAFPSKQILAVGHNLAFDQDGMLIDLQSGSVVAQLPDQQYGRIAAFSTNDQWLAEYNKHYATLSVWDVATQTRRSDIQAPHDILVRLLCSPTGEMLYGISESGAIFRWSMQ